MKIPPRAFRLSQAGGDRATAYTMSSKILRLDDQLLVTWLGVDRVNQYTLVDAETDRVTDAGSIGDVRLDNHCGAALAAGPDGTLHALTGGHHTPLDHYIAEPGAALRWRHAGRIDDQATYPSLAALSDGTLIAAYRAQTGRHWGLHIATEPPGGTWTHRRLLEAATPGYVFLTNALHIDHTDTVHLVTGWSSEMTGDYYFSAAHLISKDAGVTWRQLGYREPIEAAMPIDFLNRIDGHQVDSARRFPVDRLDEQPPGPRHSNYFFITVSNVVTLPTGEPVAILHNMIERDAELRRWNGEKWLAAPLLPTIREVIPGHRIHTHGSLSVASDGSLYAALILTPDDQPGWGPDGSETVGVRLTPEGEIRGIEYLLPPDEKNAQWLPALERDWPDGAPRPPCLLTRGHNAGGFDHNQNATPSEVWLVR